MNEVLTASVSARKKEIVRQYLKVLDEHVDQLKSGKALRALEIRDFASLLHVHPVHLSNTIKEVTGQSSCSFYEARLLTISKELLLDSNMSIGEIAIRLTYDPSNFTKFFKNYTGITPKQFRMETVKSETVTIYS
jgi:AraC-like DNA-binding protein